MYLDFYGLAEQPFNLTPDSKFLFLSRRHKDALAALVYGVNERKGFICLSGEIGSGKTTLYRTLLAQLDKDRVKAAVILNSYLSDIELLKTINQEYGLQSNSDSKKELLDELNHFLVEQFMNGVNCVLILDEAQNLRPETLEQIRMISNLETETDKLIQMILVGQPELRRTLALPELEQLNQRITVRHHVTPLSEDEIAEYIQHRLRVAHAQVAVEFTPQALRLLFHYSKGVPRRINVICDRCLLLGYVTSRYDIDGDMVQQAVEELRGELGQEEAGEPAAGAAAPVSAAPKSPASGWMQFALAGLVLLGIVAGGVWLGATLKEGGGLGRGNAMDKFLSQKPDPTKPIAMAEEETKEPDASDGSERTDGKDGKTQSRKKPKKEKGDAKDKGEIAETKASSKTGAIEAIGASLNASSNAGTSADAATTGTQSSAPRPTRTPIPPTPWQFDADHIVRVIDPAHASAASHITLIFTWGMEVDLSTFADAPQDQIIRYDLPAMMRQLDFMSFNTADLSQALLLDLPMMIRFNSTPENGLPPCGAVLKMQGDLFTLADPLRGLRNVTRKEIESSVREITIPYRDPKNLTGLVVGAAGDGVAELQKILARAGRNVPAFDGKFGAKLSDQLRTFQKQNKLPVTGNVDPMTAAFIATLREPGRPRLYS